MYWVKTPLILKKLYPSLIWNAPKIENTIYLTFDDGPIPEITPWVLEILKSYEAKATFFCIGDNIKKHPAVFNSILTKGHGVGNHTHNHLNGWKTDTAIYINNILKCDKLIQSNLFRPPYGRIKNAQIKELKRIKPELRIVMWDVLSGDFDLKLSPEKCLKTVLKHTEPGSIVVFHDSLKAEKNLRYTLPKALEYWQKKGFKFEILDDVII